MKRELKGLTLPVMSCGWPLRRIEVRIGVKYQNQTAGYIAVAGLFVS